MNDAFLMRLFQSPGDLFGDTERFVHRNRTSLDALGQRLSGDEFHDEELPPAEFLQAMNGCDIGMIQGRQHARFTLESRHAFVVVAEGFGKELDGDTPAQLGVGGLIDVAHPARSQMLCDLVVCEFRSDHDVRRSAGGFYQITHVTRVFEAGRRKVRCGRASGRVRRNNSICRLRGMFVIFSAG